MADVVRILPGFGKRSPDAMLECARNVGLNDVLIIGWAGDEFFFSSSYECNKEVLWDLKQAEMLILHE